jgi:hypothetical protein
MPWRLLEVTALVPWHLAARRTDRRGITIKILILCPDIIYYKPTPNIKEKEVCDFLGRYVPKFNNSLVDVFRDPPCERRAAFSASRAAVGLGSAPLQVDVSEAVYVPQYFNDNVVRSIVSAEFLQSMEVNNYAFSSNVGKLINVSHPDLIELPNFWASQMMDRDMDYDPVEGQFYWVPANAKRETWWRTSIQYNAQRMPSIAGKQQASLRKHIRAHVERSGLTLGPYFIETVSNNNFPPWDYRRYWFDIYAPTEKALNIIAMAI